MGYTHFTKIDRLEISILLNKGHSIRGIGHSLGKNPSSISREIKNNSVQGKYDPVKAHNKSLVKRSKSKYQGMKIRNNSDLENYIRNKLRRRWSPEEISGRIKKADKHISYVSPPIIYKYLYSVYGQTHCKYLYSKRYWKRKRKSEKTKREIIKNRVFIDFRPKIINEQKRYGDWEGDTLGAIKSDESRIAGAVERKSKYFLASKISRLKYTINGLRLMLNPYQRIFHSITLDNGVENVRYQELEAKTYFCHPYSAWEKPLIENTFMRLRRFVPKGVSLKNYSQNDINRFVDWMNNTPRKCLDFRTPREVFEEQLIKLGCCT